MPDDFDYNTLGLDYSEKDNEVFSKYISRIANKELLRYKQIIHTGGKQGESLYTHILNLVTLLEKLRPTFGLTPIEMCCMLLALSTHDLNKLPEYGKDNQGRSVKYATAAGHKHIVDELVSLHAETFFPAWRTYEYDIVYLAHAHQVGSLVTTLFDQRRLAQCCLDERHLEGPLQALMKGLDVSDNSHSGDYTLRNEKHIRDKMVNHINTAMAMTQPPRRRFRFVGHRLAEQRGLLTNVMHGVIVTFFQEQYGVEACLDVLYHPEGVDYLLDTRLSFEQTPPIRQLLATRIAQRLASLQEDQLAQFIKGKPSGISVDAAAIQSGASLEHIFDIIYTTVQRKQYRLEWRDDKDMNIRKDIMSAYEQSNTPAVRLRLEEILRQSSLIPKDDEVIRRGEFLMAYRNFLKDHRSDQLKQVKQDAWERVARLYHLHSDFDILYQLIDPYRRGYFMARDLPTYSLDEMLEAALRDVQELDSLTSQMKSTQKGKKEQSSLDDTSEADNEGTFAVDSSSLLDYLERNLELWEAFSETSTEKRAIQTINFVDTLARYADQKHVHTQCCYCGSALHAGEWMSLQVPPNIGVQSFSNRLEAGSSREPKRNVCDICRTQFVLEKLAWPTHRDKQDSKQTTFYLHLFPYSHFTKPLLSAWWRGIQNMRGVARSSFFVDISLAFRTWKDWQAEIRIDRKHVQGNDGVCIPMISDAISNTPVLPLIMTAQSYSKRFLLALETTLIVARWFDCRVILSRMPIPSLNLATQTLGDNEPVALMIENAPRVLSWLVPTDVFSRSEVEQVLYPKLITLHAIAQTLSLPLDEVNEHVYNFIVSAADDPFALYYELDRLIERNAARKRGGKPEYEAIRLTHLAARQVQSLLEIEEHSSPVTQ